MKNLYNNIFISIMLTTAIVGYDIAHTGKVTNVVAADTQALEANTEAQDTTKIVVGEIKITPTDYSNKITVKVSHYWPNLGGLNCLTFVDGNCISKMANGQRWQDHIDEAIACPPELSFGTKIEILGKTWTCRDRGSMIVKTENNEYWVDQLTEKAVVPYGQVVTGEIVK